MSHWKGPVPAIPSILLFDDTGLQTFTSTGEFHTWDTQQHSTSHFRYKLDGDTVILENNQYNMYEVTFECSFFTQVSGTIIIYSELYKNGTAINGSRTYTSSVGSGQGTTTNGNVSIHFLLYLKGGDTIQVKTITNNAGATYSYTKSSRLMVNFVPIRGWDNSKAGRIEYKGSVLR